MAVSVLIVCKANICRSPTGEAVLRHSARRRGFDLEVHSAGTSAIRIGETPHLMYAFSITIGDVQILKMSRQDCCSLRRST